MDQHDPPIAPITDPDEQADALRQVIDLIESGEAASGAIRLTRHDGTVEEIVFGDSEEERTMILDRLRAGIKRGMH